MTQVIDPSIHPRILEQLELCLSPQTKNVNWRFREALGLQLHKLIEMHEQIMKENCLLYFIGLSLKLMNDRYNCVRKIGMDTFIEALKRSTHQNEVLKFFRNQFAYDLNWKRKQLYILTVDQMVRFSVLYPRNIDEIFFSNS